MLPSVFGGNNKNDSNYPPSSPSSVASSSTKSRSSLRLLATRGFRHRPQSVVSNTSSSTKHTFDSQSSNNSNSIRILNSEHTGINYSSYNNPTTAQTMYSRQGPFSDAGTADHNFDGPTLATSPNYYATTADYDGGSNSVRSGVTFGRHRSRSGSDHHGHSPILPTAASTIRSLSPPSLYDHRNSYEESYIQQQESRAAQQGAMVADVGDNKPRTSIFPPTSEMQQAANLALEANNKTFKVIYAGIMSYKATTAMISVNKRLYFVLTNHHLLQYKSEQKARSEIDLFDTQQHRNGTSTNAAHINPDKVVVRLCDIFGIHSVVSPPNTFRIEYLQPDTKQPQALVLTSDNSKECQQWISGFRHAIKVHHVSMMAQGTVTSTEKFAAVERLSKQKDMVDKRRNPLMIHKVIYKEKRIKVADGKNSTKEVFQVVSLVVGKFSLYLLPPSGVADDKYLKSVERDRYGLLAIHSIQYSGEDDTFKLLLGQVGHATRQLALVSTYCEYIIQHLRQAIHAVALTTQSLTYTAVLPAHLRHAFISPLQTLVEDNPDSADYAVDAMDQDALQLNIVLHAYCAALNLNKARFHYKLAGQPGGPRSFILLPPHEVNESPASYTSFELLAMCRALYLNVSEEMYLILHDRRKTYPHPFSPSTLNWYSDGNPSRRLKNGLSTRTTAGHPHLYQQHPMY